MRQRPLVVVAGVLTRADGHCLLAQRPPGKREAGLYEFPGGKLRPGESLEAALARELDEELGIRIGPAQRWRCVRQPLGAGRVLHLHALRVASWQGEPQAHDHQCLRWVRPAELIRYPMPEADRPLAASLAFPRHYLITPAAVEAVLPGLRQSLARARAAGWLQDLAVCLRLPGVDRQRLHEVALAVRQLTRAEGIPAILHGDAELAEALDYEGLHSSAAQMRAVSGRPVSASRWWIASCHDRTELAQADALGADLATLSPVQPSLSHPGAPSLGWKRFAALARHANLPLLALGGLGPADLNTAQQRGAHGIAGIRGF